MPITPTKTGNAAFRLFGGAVLAAAMTLSFTPSALAFSQEAVDNLSHIAHCKFLIFTFQWDEVEAQCSGVGPAPGKSIYDTGSGGCEYYEEGIQESEDPCYITVYP